MVPMPKRAARPKRLPPGQSLEPRPDVPLPEKFAGLPEPERAALHSIIADRYATVVWSALALAHGVDVLERLEAAGLIERWVMPHQTRVTLTVWAADGIPLAERREWVPVEDVDALGRVTRRSTWGDEPYWCPHGTEWGPRCPGKNRRGVAAYRSDGPIAMVALTRPELVVDKRPGPEFLLDEVSEEPVKLFAGEPEATEPHPDLAGGLGSATGGIPVKIDRRALRKLLGIKLDRAKPKRKRGPKRRVG
jgi:hypothetical protein